MKYEETRGDYFEKTFTDIQEAYDYMNNREYYNPGWHYRCVMREQTIIEVITNSERNQIAGRFALVGKGDNWRVIGTVGNLFPHDLNRRQKQFVASWYFLEQDGSYSFEVLDSYPESTLPHSNFNGFLRITKT